MATIRLTRDESETGKLPGVCMRCGAPATELAKKDFTWVPAWVWVTILAGALPYVMLSIVLQQRMKLWAPMCRQHRHHWLKRLAFNLIACVVVVGALAGMAALPDAWGLSQSEKESFRRWSGVGMAVLLTAWLIANVVIHQFMIRPARITDDDMELKGVHESFQAALVSWRIGDEAADGRETSPRVPPGGESGEFYDPNARKQRPREE
jgi:hypothetical protein